MRPAGRGPLDSLYFQYPTFQSQRAPELDGPSQRHPVVIVGAGPIGLTAALTLAAYGVPSVLLECKNTFNDGSRAICIARSSMQILQRIGAVEPFLAKALGWRYGRSYFRGSQIYRLEMPHSEHEKYLPMYNLQQQYIEQYLYDAAARSPLIDLRWQSDVVGIESGAKSATLNVASPHGGYAIEAEYVLAADGARSPLRSKMGLRLSGDNYEGRYVIADIRMDHDFPTERRAFFEPASNPDGTVLIHKQPGNIWRIDYQLRDSEDADAAVQEAEIRGRVQAIVEDIGHRGPWDLEWWSIYTANTLCLDDYAHGRVFFIGDSAHIVPIFGVRGLNNGLADACNIGWKLAYVLDGTADAHLLDSYSPERRGATLDVFANATKSTRFMTPPTRGWALARQAALSLAVRHDFPRGLANPRQMQPYSYAGSPLTAEEGSDAAFTTGPAPGAVATDAKLADGTHLLDHVGVGFTGLLFVASAPTDAQRQALQLLRQLDARFTTRIVTANGSADLPDAIHDSCGALTTLYGASTGTFYLLRPDLHVAGRWTNFDSDAIVRTLQIYLGKAAS